MLDLKAIREDSEPIRKALARRGAAEDLDRVLALDEEWRRLTVRVEERRAEQKRGSKEVAAAGPSSRERVIARPRAGSSELKQPELQLAQVEEEVREGAGPV